MNQREHKFRAWHNTAKKYLEHGSNRQIFLWLDEGQDITIEEFTGLTDKNGVEIFEGDIVSDGKTIFTVEWNQQNTSFWIIAKRSFAGEEWAILVLNSSVLGNGYYSRKDLTVIFNINQNPELL